jgi:hypothetical protein
MFPFAGVPCDRLTKSVVDRLELPARENALPLDEAVGRAAPIAADRPISKL